MNKNGNVSVLQKSRGSGPRMNAIDDSIESFFDSYNQVELSQEERERIDARFEQAMLIAKEFEDDGSEFNPQDVPVLSKHTVCRMTPSFAKNVLQSYNHAEFQRNINQSRVLTLARRQRDGRFHGNDISFAIFEGRIYLINGQHTLSAMVVSGKTVNNVYKVFKCSTIEQLACAWAQFDDGGTRTRKQVAKNYRQVLGQEWNEDAIALVSIACSLIKYGTTALATAGNVEDRIKLIPEFGRPAEGVRDVVFSGEPVKKKSKECRMLNKGPIAHAMLLCFVKDFKAAQMFWSSVKTGIGFDSESDPRHVLRRYLEELSLSNTNVGKNKQKDNNDVVTGKCLVAWNLYRNQEQVPIKRNKAVLRFTGNVLPEAE